MDGENNREGAAVDLEDGRGDGPRWAQMEQEVCRVFLASGRSLHLDRDVGVKRRNLANPDRF